MATQLIALKLLWLWVPWQHITLHYTGVKSPNVFVLCIRRHDKMALFTVRRHSTFSVILRVLTTILSNTCFFVYFFIYYMSIFVLCVCNSIFITWLRDPLKNSESESGLLSWCFHQLGTDMAVLVHNSKQRRSIQKDKNANTASLEE